MTRNTDIDFLKGVAIIGRMFRENNCTLAPSNKCGVLIACGITMLSILAILFMIGSWRGRYSGPECLYLPSFVVSSIAGWILMLSVSRIFYMKWGHAVVEYVGQHTMPILILHLVAFKLVVKFGVLYYGHQAFVIAGFLASYHGWWWSIIYTIVGVALPLVVAHFYSRIKDSIRGLL